MNYEFCTGEIVRWKDELWIVSKCEDKELVLLSMTHCNCKTIITENRKVEWVASSTMDFIYDILDNTARGMGIIRNKPQHMIEGK